MKNMCSYAVTNSANATLAVSTTASAFCGAQIGGGIGTLTILDGTALVATLKTTANNDVVSLAPTLPAIFRTSINATCSGTGNVTVFYAILS